LDLVTFIEIVPSENYLGRVKGPPQMMRFWGLIRRSISLGGSEAGLIKLIIGFRTLLTSKKIVSAREILALVITGRF